MTGRTKTVVYAILSVWDDGAYKRTLVLIDNNSPCNCGKRDSSVSEGSFYHISKAI